MKRANAEIHGNLPVAADGIGFCAPEVERGPLDEGAMPTQKRVKFADLPRATGSASDTGQGSAGRASQFWENLQRGNPSIPDMDSVFRDDDVDGGGGGGSGDDDDDDYDYGSLRGAGSLDLGGVGDEEPFQVLEKADNNHKMEKMISYQTDDQLEERELAGETLGTYDEEERLIARAMALKQTDPELETLRFGAPENDHPVVRKHFCVLCKYGMSSTKDTSLGMLLIVLGDLEHCEDTYDAQFFQEQTTMFNNYNLDLKRRGGNAVFVRVSEMARHMMKHMSRNKVRILLKIERRLQHIALRGSRYIFGKTPDGELYWNTNKTDNYGRVARLLGTISMQIHRHRLINMVAIADIKARLKNANVDPQKYAASGTCKFNARNLM